MKQTLTWKIGGPAGFGIMSVGPLFTKALKQKGYYTHGYPEYPSLIRGGYNCYQIAFSSTPVYNPYSKVDIYVALSDEGFKKETEFSKETIIIGDFENLKLADDIDSIKLDVPFKQIVADLQGVDIMKNSVALGASAKVLDIEFEIIESLLKEIYNEKIAEKNIQAAKKGYDFVTTKHTDISPSKDNCAESMVLSGNESTVIGAVHAGMNFYSTYPMTPASSILHNLANLAREYSIVVKHTEDEISGINMAIGASFAGARAMTGTSGGGFALMNEGLGLAAITETPLVLAVSQRPGPATGMPTWQEQGDIKYILNSSQGEFVRAIFTPGDVKEAFEQTYLAFDLADKYQIPVFVVLDKFLSESHFMTSDINEIQGDINRGFLFEGNEEEPDAYFERYTEKENGIPVRSIPGTKGGLFIASSNEHDKFGFVSDLADNRVEQTERRFRKEEPLRAEMPKPVLIGEEIAPITFVCFGSTKLALLEAMKHDNNFNIVYFPAIHPIDWAEAHKLMNDKNLVIIENNYTAQLADIIAQNTGILIESRFLKYDGRPFFTEEIIEFIQGELA
jgi:2-oxoglutarate ferredoxin oxidoreductase subunit alpha